MILILFYVWVGISVFLIALGAWSTLYKGNKSGTTLMTSGFITLGIISYLAILTNLNGW